MNAHPEREARTYHASYEAHQTTLYAQGRNKITKEERNKKRGEREKKSEKKSAEKIAENRKTGERHSKMVHP